ncbi:hypothetical protein L2E82_16555 [Cichorium intybus]|uniref:Uncharacterized protein n=1 Tax=Cichorium intybus TaxID=13427 RepID=A0ACB9F5W2_CICIN|nr:hypothetical protein L2E82_16555 [Cichorium intybus]
MDFWLSFMAVVSTFVYLAAIDEASKRTIHTIVAILTALMAETGATRSSNIVLVIAIGSIALLTGWLIEFFTRYRHFSFSTELFLNMLHRWQTIKGWIHNLLKTFLRRFRCYWFWHSMWHVSIYTSSFFFLCSKVTVKNCENQGSTNIDYRLTRQDSLSRGEDRSATG